MGIHPTSRRRPPKPFLNRQKCSPRLGSHYKARPPRKARGRHRRTRFTESPMDMDTLSLSQSQGMRPVHRLSEELHESRISRESSECLDEVPTSLVDLESRLYLQRKPAFLQNLGFEDPELHIEDKPWAGRAVPPHFLRVGCHGHSRSQHLGSRTLMWTLTLPCQSREPIPSAPPKDSPRPCSRVPLLCGT